MSIEFLLSCGRAGEHSGADERWTMDQTGTLASNLIA
jgi:hypothetical protein